MPNDLPTPACPANTKAEAWPGKGDIKQMRKYLLTIKMFTRVCLVFLLIFNLGDSPFVHGQTPETRGTNRHFILLVDSTKAVIKNIFQDNRGRINDDFFELLNKTLETDPYTVDTAAPHKKGDYEVFIEGKDLVSFVLYHFPLEQAAGKYFITSENAALIKDFTGAKKSLGDFSNRQFRSFKTLHPETDARKIAEEMVLPFLSNELDEYMKKGRYREFEKTVVDNIVIISIYDGGNKKIHSQLFPGEWKKFNTCFNYVDINGDQTHFRYSGGNLEPVTQSRPDEIYVDYIVVKPNGQDNFVSLEVTDKNTLERISKKSNKEPVLFRKGKSGIAFQKGQYTCHLEWSAAPMEGKFAWQPVEPRFAENNYLSFDENYANVYIKKEAGDTLLPFEKEIYYRLVITDYKKKHKDINYPFSYSPAAVVKSTVYTSREWRGDEGDFPAYYTFKIPWEIAAAGIITDRQLKEIHKKTDRDELSDVEASRSSENSALRQRFLFLSVVFAVLLAAAVTLTRKPKIGLAVDQILTELPVDFSRENQGKQTLAALELRNTRKWLLKFKQEKKFNLALKLTGSFKSKSPTGKVDYDFDRLLAIEKIREGEETGQYLRRQADGFYRVEFPGVSAGEKFKILLNADAVKDLHGETGEKKAAEVIFELIMAVEAARFIKKQKPGPIPVKKESRALTRYFKFIFTPEKGKVEVYVMPVEEPEGEREPGDFKLNPDHETLTIPFSIHHPARELFKLVIKNESRHHFSSPFNGELVHKIFERNTLLDSGKKIFYLSTVSTVSSGDQWDEGGILPQKQEIRLAYGEEKGVSVYIKFPDIPENPDAPRDFRIQVQVLEDGDAIKSGNLPVSVTGAVERTEALVGFIDEKGVTVEPTDKNIKILDKTRALMINDDSEDRVAVEFRFPGQGRMVIMENEPTLLFTLKLGNSCITRSGWYEWEIPTVQLVENDRVQLKKGVLADKAVYYKIYRGSRKIEDQAHSGAEIEFYLDNEKVKVKDYEVSAEVNFSLLLDFYSKGKEKGKTGSKQVDIKAVVQGSHYVAHDYLVIDFGTSAIAVEKRSRGNGGMDQENTYRVKFESPRDHLESKDGLLPSIINLNRNKIIGSHSFVSLPAEKNLKAIDPDILVSSLKLHILEGNDRIEFPGGFSYINRDGVACTGRDKNRKTCSAINNGGMNCERLNKDELSCTGDYIDLHNLMVSAYRNLKQNYLNPRKEIRGYKRLVITHPNLYGSPHIEFLKRVLCDAFVDKDKNIYEQNIVPVSESDAALYKYLQNRARENTRRDAEKIMLIDIGGGTLDISLAKVEWKETGTGNIPARIEVKKKDGAAFAGDVLDKAIALQVHRILLQYEAQQSQRPQPGADDSLRTAAADNDLTSEDEREAWLRKMDAEAGTGILKPDNGANRNQSKFSYQKKIAAADIEISDEEDREKLIQAMLEFKLEHILKFKEDMGAASPEREVNICLGKNGDLCLLDNAERMQLRIKSRERPINTEIQIDNGILYLTLKRKDWLELDYLQRFEKLFIDKINSFYDSDMKAVPGEFIVVLSGRTSLWPPISRVLESKECLGVKPVYIDHHSQGSGNALALKQAVAEGALQKVVTWNHIPFTGISEIGDPAVRYQTGPDPADKDSWAVEILDKTGPKPIDLSNSAYFYLGTKTSMGFVPFRENYFFDRDRFCKEKMAITIHMKEVEAQDKDGGKKVKDREFFIQSDIYDKPPYKRLSIEPGEMKYRFLIRGKYWPLNDPRLPDVNPENFDE
jgi:hypothetical protein